MRNKPALCLVTPALADANNGNWQTAQRWARMLSGDYVVHLLPGWAAGSPPAQALIALHARRSAASVAAWKEAFPSRPLVLVLTGTDLYRDIDTDPSAQHSLRLADALVVLQGEGLSRLPAELRPRAVVVLQSTPSRRPLEKTSRHLRALAVGHLREEKNPRLYFQAARLLAGRSDVYFDHIGAGLDATLAQEAQALAAELPRYRWLGALPHAATRARIQRAHLLVHMSHMEGGAHVVMEAAASGTPVLASRISGNLGMLGREYSGYFEPGDAHGLAALLQRCRIDPAMLAHLRRQCLQRAALFAPERERAALRHLMATLLETPKT